MNYARLHIIIGLIYLCLGMTLGLVMGFTMDTQLVVVHAHWMLIGGVVTILYGVILTNWSRKTGLVPLQFSVHHIGTAVVAVGSPLFYGVDTPHPITGPVIGVASAIVLLGALLMIPVVISSDRTEHSQ